MDQVVLDIVSDFKIEKKRSIHRDGEAHGNCETFIYNQDDINYY